MVILMEYRETLFAVRTARDLLWSDERKLNIEYFVVISQTYESYSDYRLTSYLATSQVN